MRISIQLLFIFFFSSMLFSQSNISIGEWKSYLPLNNGKSIDVGGGNIYIAANAGLIVLDEQDLSETFYTKVEGLSGVSIEKIKFDEVRNQLIIVYEDSSFDLFTPNSTFQVLDIKLNTDILGSKKVNDVAISQNNSNAYLSTDFGIVEYDLEKREFGFSCFTNERIFDADVRGSTIFIAAESGSYYFDFNSNANPSDFNTWTFLGLENSLPEVYGCNEVSIVNEKIYLNVDDRILVETTELQFEEVYEFDDSNYHAASINSYSDGWILTLLGNTSTSDVVFFNNENMPIVIENECTNFSNDAVQDGEGRIWISDRWDGVRYKDNVDATCQYLNFNGPFSSELSDVKIKDDQIFVASGGVSDIFNYNFSDRGFYMYNGQWTNVNKFNYQPFNDNDILNVFQVLPHPKENKLYIGTYWAGLIEYNLDDQSYIQYDSSNSSLGVAIGDEQRTRISDMAFDNDGNLWIANYAAEKPLSVLTTEGIWHSFSIGTTPKSIASIAVNEQGQIWMRIAGNSGGVYVYDIGESVADPTDGETPRFFTMNNSELPTSQIKSIAIDKSGDVWVGTTEGVVVFECNPFDLDCVGSQPLVDQDGNLGQLLGSESVQAILIDGADRKWFGTKKGLFLQSSDGELQLDHFTESNSPLFSDEIIDLAYNDNNGELLIGTTKGLQSYRTKSSGATRKHAAEVYAFPNPVYPDYQGDIAIKGLARNANVKITDMNGKLVYETTALGGQAIWNGRNYNGINAARGVYLVFSSTTNTFEDIDTHVAKILLMK